MGNKGIKSTIWAPEFAFTADSKRRYRILSIFIHMINFMTRAIGLNQVRKVKDDEGAELQPWIKRLADENMDLGRHNIKKGVILFIRDGGRQK